MEEKKEELEKCEALIKQPTEYSKRVCTDVCCLLIGLLFSIGIIVYALLTLNHTQINQTSVPSDSEGKMCGIDYPNYPYIYFTNPPNIASRVCVSHCPKSGDIQLDCAVAGQIGCKFNTVPGFAVTYYESTSDSDSNGNFCMPSDSALKDKVTTNSNLQERLLFFKSYNVLVLSFAFAAGLSILYMFLVYCFPKPMVWATVVLSILVLIGLTVILFLYKTSNKTKIIIGICLGVFVVIYLISVCCNKNAIKLSSIFIKEGTKFAGKNPSTIFYVFLFLALTTGLAFLLIWQYRAFISSSSMSFDKTKGLYYVVASKLIYIKYFLLIVQALWGFSFLKESCNFCISNHAVRWYLKKGGGLCTIPDTLKLWICKHLGSIIAGSFINIFLFVPDLIMDFFRFGQNNDETGSCCSCFDLVRTDSIAFIALTGNPYCNASKYCEYLTYQSISSETSQSATRFYRIGAHILIAGAVSIIGLYIKGQIQPYIIIATFLIGIFISTYFISYYADSADSILLMFGLEEQFTKRQRDGMSKSPVNPQDSTQRKYFNEFLANLKDKSSDREDLAVEVAELKNQEWKSENTESPK